MSLLSQSLILPLRDIVVLPGMVVPLFVGRQKSIKSLNHSVQEGKKIILLAQKDDEIDDPKVDDFYQYGCLADIVQLMKLPDGNIKVIVEGLSRVKIYNLIDDGQYFIANYDNVEETDIFDAENDILQKTLINSVNRYAKLNKKLSQEILNSFNKINNASRLSDLIAAHINPKVEIRQQILEQSNVKERLEAVLALVENEILEIELDKQIHNKVKETITENHRKYYLSEQKKIIQEQLDEGDELSKEINELKEQVEKLKLSKEAKEKALSEIKKLGMMSIMSAESTVIRNYLDWLLNLPWGINTKINKNFSNAQKILDRDHAGLEKVKERVVEYLAVQKRVNKIKGPIICFVGPPGVGKTSLAKSIAEATGRKFAHLSLGGINDVSEIKGHRRTYIGSMPGKIIQALKKVKSSNPLILLDEIDKLGKDFRGDPSSALLELLDYQQNDKFNDHYLEVDYDLSKVMFIATANSYNIPKPLLDRMEIIKLEGYTENEKLDIAQSHLIPKQFKEHGLKDDEVILSKDSIMDIIRYYTREAGVRNLERNIAKIARKSIRKIDGSIVNKNAKKVENIEVSSKNLKDFLGVRKFTFGELEKDDLRGVVNGLAYTEYGGDILKIEAVAVSGKGNIKYTGKLGEVMQESVQAAYSLIRSVSYLYGIQQKDFEKKDIHLHVPEGATPKDGPSAGIAIATVITSLMSGIPIRNDIAMTGEITLRGRVLAIGGLKEKLLAALRSGIKKVLIPKENEKDLEEISDEIKSKLCIVAVESIDEVLEHALVVKPSAISLDDVNDMMLESDLEDTSELTSITH